MIELHDEMLLYHGSYIGIPEIDLDRCFSGLDFGRGFYLTSSYEQAYHYVSFQSGRLSASEPSLRTLTLMMGRFLYTNSTMTPTFSLTAFREQALNGCIS